jgi:hypothetical protein
VPALSTTAILLTKEASESPVTGIESRSSANDVKIHPNPASDKLLLGINSARVESLEITVSDQWGRKIQSAKRNSDGITPVSLDVSAIPNGFYLVSIRRAGGISIGKFVVAR